MLPPDYVQKAMRHALGDITPDDCAGAGCLAIKDIIHGALVDSGGGGGGDGGGPVARVGKQRKGLNPYLTFRNREMAGKKASVGMRTLSPEEVADVDEECRERWDVMPDDEKSLYINLFSRRQRLGGADAVRGDSALANTAAREAAYRPHFGVGTPTMPVDTEHFTAYFNEAGGFPDDEEVYKPQDFVVRPEHVMSENEMLGGQAL